MSKSSSYDTQSLLTSSKDTLLKFVDWGTDATKVLPKAGIEQTEARINAVSLVSKEALKSYYDMVAVADKGKFGNSYARSGPYFNLRFVIEETKGHHKRSHIYTFGGDTRGNCCKPAFIEPIALL